MSSAGRISSSHKLEDVRAAAAVCRALLNGGDARMLSRSPEFRRFAGSVIRLASKSANLPTRPPVVRHRARMLEALEGKEPMRAKAIAEMLGVSMKVTRWMLQQERYAGRVRLLPGHRWELVPKAIVLLLAGAR